MRNRYEYQYAITGISFFNCQGWQPLMNGIHRQITASYTTIYLRQFTDSLLLRATIDTLVIQEGICN